MLTLFIGLPLSIWLLSFSVLIIGLLLIYAATRISHARPVWKEFVRDIGVAFIVAVVVTFLYEAYVRTVLETGNIGHMLATVLKYNVPLNVWEEVDRNVFNSPAIRRNVKIDFEIKPYKPERPDLALLFITYNYELYRLKPNSAPVDIQHKVVNDYDNLARFEHVVITDWQGNILKEYKPLNEQEREKIFLETVHMELGYNFKDNVYLDDKAVHVKSRRLEIINLPGTYSLGIPAIIEGTRDKPIEVSVTIHENLAIIPSVDTQWLAHTFTPLPKQGNRYAWSYTGVILPGQFLNVLVNPPVTSTLAISP